VIGDRLVLAEARPQTSPHDLAPIHIRWKVKKDGAAPIDLYQLSTDIGETRNAAVEHPEVVAKMRAINDRGAHAERRRGLERSAARRALIRGS